jgi:RNA polymerase sigma factor (sigma-70 family)
LKFSTEDHSTWLPVVREVIRVSLPGGFPAYVDQDDIEQECFIKIPEIISDYRGAGGAAIDTFVRTAIRNDARDYLKQKHRESSHGEAVPLPWEAGSVIDSDGSRVRGGESQAFLDKYVGAPNWLPTCPTEAITEDDLEAVQSVLTREQYQVYVCRFLLCMTQQEAADYLRTTREAIASRQRKIAANLTKAGIPVPNRVA